MSKLRIGVIGTGAIGREHITRITERLQRGEVVAVYDVFEEGAKKAAEICGARVESSEEALINAVDVDAIICTSIPPAHANTVMTAVKAGKPIFCEKPLATTAADALKVVEAEVEGGKHLVQVGFMRRYDKSFRQLKELLDSGKYGNALMIHNSVRAQEVPESYDTPMAVTDTHIHEIDCLHWMINEEYVSAQAIFPRQTRNTHGNLQDPQFFILRTESGIVVTTDCFVNSIYGYEVRCKIVCENGELEKAEPSFPLVRQGEKKMVEIETDWKRCFNDAYDTEIQDWIDSSLKGEVNGPNAWDGYFAAITCDAMVKSQQTKAIEPIKGAKRPAFYN
ncbi:MAG: Gfo/Idh/MocA family oxidoreductase [Eubacterium sp.]|nr:Gfo/Idh/MocA family oxidoreductase [Eubacterium sp.]